MPTTNSNTRNTSQLFKKEQTQNGIRVAKDFTSLLNKIHHQEAVDGFTYELIDRTHRTLQQSAGNCFLSVIKLAAKRYEEGNYDHRNEHFYKWCKEVIEKTDCEFDFPYI